MPQGPQTLGQPHLVLRDVSRTFRMGGGVVNALHGVNLTIAQGAFVAVMGASGSGKSTLMNILGLLDTPTSGDYMLAGHPVATLNANAQAALRGKLLGFVFQGFHLLPRTSALHNVELPLIYQGVAKKQRRARAEAALAKVGLSDRLHHTPAQLSGGQQQRVAIARALINNPEVLLADEPTGNLDSATTEEVMNLFAALHQDNMTVVMVTHEHDIASYAQRVLTFRDGAIINDAHNAQVRGAS